MEYGELVRARHSVKTYAPGVNISDETLRTIFEDVVLSPSSFNLQHWRFVVVRDQAMKLRLKDAANGQNQVADASAVVVICGKLDAYDDAEAIHAAAAPEFREGLVSKIRGFYRGNPRLQRDEAIRSGSLAAMSLMYAAKHHGYDTGPMIGFSPDEAAALLDIPDNLLPVMMVVMGKCHGPQPERRGRLPVSDVVRLESMDGAELA